jgi:hypothetical protein
VLYHAGSVTHCHGAHLLLPGARNNQGSGARNGTAGRELHAVWVAGVRTRGLIGFVWNSDLGTGIP